MNDEVTNGQEDATCKGSAGVAASKVHVSGKLGISQLCWFTLTYIDDSSAFAALLTRNRSLHSSRGLCFSLLWFA